MKCFFCGREASLSFEQQLRKSKATVFVCDQEKCAMKVLKVI